MSKISERLRDIAGWFERRHYKSGEVAMEAADLIDQQASEIERLRLLVIEAYYEGVHSEIEGEGKTWDDSKVRAKLEGG